MLIFLFHRERLSWPWNPHSFAALGAGFIILAGEVMLVTRTESTAWDEIWLKRQRSEECRLTERSQEEKQDLMRLMWHKGNISSQESLVDQMKWMSPSYPRYIVLSMLSGAQKIKWKEWANRKSSLCISRVLLEVKSYAEKIIREKRSCLVLGNSHGQQYKWANFCLCTTTVILQGSKRFGITCVFLQRDSLFTDRDLNNLQ